MSTIQRWEQVVPPRGPALAKLARVANEAGRPDIAGVFEDALGTELGAPSRSPESQIWSDALAEIRDFAPTKFDAIIMDMAVAIEAAKDGINDPVRFNRLERLLPLLRRMTENRAERALRSEAMEIARREGISESAAMLRILKANPERYTETEQERENALRGTQHAPRKRRK